MLEHNDRNFKSTLKKIQQDITMKFMGEHKVVLKTTRNEWVFLAIGAWMSTSFPVMQCTSGLVIIGVLYMQCVLHFIFGSIWASGVIYEISFHARGKGCIWPLFCRNKIVQLTKEKSNTELFHGWSVTRHFSPMWRRSSPSKNFRSQKCRCPICECYLEIRML